LVAKVAMRILMEGSLSVLWRSEYVAGSVEVQELWVVLDLQWSSREARCSWICEGRRSWCSHDSVSHVRWKYDMCES